MTVNAINAASARVTSAIQRAAQRTGIDFDYLLNQARVESGLNASAAAGTSSARGLYQFIEQSWLAVVKKHGATHGLGWAADSIQNNGGRLTVSGGNRAAILGLRNDPEVASLMAAEHAGDNKAAIEATLGRPANGTDLYMAHFLGLGGAKQFLSAMEGNPGRTAAAMFPAAARANRGVFYAADGSARSLSQVYERFAGKLGDGSGAIGGTPTATGAGTALQFAAQALGFGDEGSVVTGANQSAEDAMTWATSTLGRLKGAAANTTAANLFRPTPDSARLAYMLLARMGS